MVYAYMTYCNINWACTCPYRPRSILYISLKNIVKHFKVLFKSVKIMNIYEINLYLHAIFMYLHYYGKHPETLNDYCVINDSIHS